MPIVYADPVEPPLARRWKASQVLSHHRRHLVALVPVYGRLAGLHVARRPSLNFHETENVLVPSD
jgi:hypothetical protein